MIFRWLPASELATVVALDQAIRRNCLIGAHVDPERQVITLVRGTRERLEVAFDWFTTADQADSASLPSSSETVIFPVLLTHEGEMGAPDVQCRADQ
jgi:hypothetical protein